VTDITNIRHAVTSQRNSLQNSAEKVTYIKNGSLSVYSPRVCTICGSPLSSYDSLKHRYVSSFSHYHLTLLGIMKVDYCANSENCVSRLKHKEGAD